MTRRTKLRFGLFALVAVLSALALVWLFGPREQVDATVRFQESVIGSDPDAYLAEAESRVAGVDAQTAKTIVWAYPTSRARTPLAIVYVHGFSSDLRELSPVPQRIASELGANLFLTRLSGHGGDLAALAEPSANDWLNDLAEALAIGRRIGDRVVVMGTSNGGALATWGATFPDLMDDVAGLVLMSPSYGLADPRSVILSWPFGRQIADLITNGSIALPVSNEDADAPALALPTAALLPLAAMAERVRGLDFAAINLPALFIYSPQDRIVSPLEIERVAQRWGGPNEILLMDNPPDPLGHMLAGDMFSPSTTDRVTAAIVDFIERIESGAIRSEDRP